MDYAEDSSELFARRLRWRARRGLLENDLIINCFFDRIESDFGVLSELQKVGLSYLLELPDPKLLDLVLGRADLSQSAPQGAFEVLSELKKVSL